MYNNRSISINCHIVFIEYNLFQQSYNRILGGRLAASIVYCIKYFAALRMKCITRLRAQEVVTMTIYETMSLLFQAFAGVITLLSLMVTLVVVITKKK
jgi:hypothetical protein